MDDGAWKKTCPCGTNRHEPNNDTVWIAKATPREWIRKRKRDAKAKRTKRLEEERAKLAAVV